MHNYDVITRRAVFRNADRRVLVYGPDDSVPRTSFEDYEPKDKRATTSTAATAAKATPPARPAVPSAQTNIATPLPLPCGSTHADTINPPRHEHVDYGERKAGIASSAGHTPYRRFNDHDIHDTDTPGVDLTVSSETVTPIATPISPLEIEIPEPVDNVSGRVAGSPAVSSSMPSSVPPLSVPCCPATVRFDDNMNGNGMDGVPQSVGLSISVDEQEEPTPPKVFSQAAQLQSPGNALRVHMNHTKSEDGNGASQAKRYGKVLQRAYSLTVDFESTSIPFYLTQLSGSWGRERQVVETKLTQGTQSFGSVRGVSGHQHSPFAAVTIGPPSETQGEVHGTYVCEFTYM
jgi:hypothetical protein